MTRTWPCHKRYSAPEPVAVPVDRWMCFHIDVTMYFRLTSQTDVLAIIAQNFYAQQRMDPFPQLLQKSLFAAVFRTIFDDHIAAGTVSEAHTVEYPVRARIKLYPIFTSNRPNVISVCRVHGDFLIDEVDLWHQPGFRSIYSLGCQAPEEDHGGCRHNRGSQYRRTAGSGL